MKNVLLISLCVISITLSCCKKSGPEPRSTASAEQLIADSTFLLTKEIYLWNTQIPDYNSFNPRSLVKAGDPIATSDEVLKSIRSKYSSGLDKWSFAVSSAESDQIQTGTGEDWGFFVRSALNPSNVVKWYITYVNRSSSAGVSGVRRGWYINKVNSTPVEYNNAGATILNNLLFGTVLTANIEFITPDGSAQTLNLTKTVHTANAVMYSRVYDTINVKKIGYLAYNQFFQGGYTKELKAVFNGFAALGVNELIIDLRNNRGGSVATQDTLANLIAPASATASVMYQYEFNQQLQGGNFPLLKQKYGWSSSSFSLQNNTQRFVKLGSMNLSRVFFITTRNSASASELLINNLKPVMDVQIIGDTTDGKPVGYFPIDLFKDVSFYAVSFRTINGAGNADFYQGFFPNKVVDERLKLVDWGDPADQSLAQALYYINNGSYQAVAPNNTLNTLQRSVYSQGALENKLNSKKFSGMFRDK